MQLNRNFTRSHDHAGTTHSIDKPLANQDVVDLFDYLENALANHECEHSFHITEAYLASNGLNSNRVLPWLRKCGANCDCEILGDFEFKWRQS